MTGCTLTAVAAAIAPVVVAAIAPVVVVAVVEVEAEAVVAAGAVVAADVEATVDAAAVREMGQRGAQAYIAQGPELSQPLGVV